ncbi:MAG TPA: hypothetical protein ENG92_04410 [Thiolapillus brandeum]|uniref:BrnA antitoxin family protein n=1 Tax=Thiolapillus brandeum TaxID=1076588 RepID=A0A831K9B9_9GAMM|nr:hypothetical protein [Thiolapillus brandeum]
MNTTVNEKIDGSEDAWDEGRLGVDEEFVSVAEADEDGIDAALDLQMISIRLQKSLIEDFKHIAALHGLGYQPLMRQVLTRFADSEKKRLLRKMASEHIKDREEAEKRRLEAEQQNTRKTA